MTVPFPLDAFDQANLVVQRKPARDKSRLISIGITVALHAVVVGVALSAVQVVHKQAPPVLTVEITETKREILKDLAPPPKMQQPTIMTAVVPEFSVRSQSPITAPPPAANPAPVQPAAGPSPMSGDGRNAFQASVLAHINRFKQYPREARNLRFQGVTLVHFIMDQQGQLLLSEVYKSSGRPALDEAALATVQRAQPLPAIPSNFPTTTLDAIVSVEFTRR